jgi:hypothetical protein
MITQPASLPGLADLWSLVLIFRQFCSRFIDQSTPLIFDHQLDLF